MWIDDIRHSLRHAYTLPTKKMNWQESCSAAVANVCRFKPIYLCLCTHKIERMLVLSSTTTIHSVSHIFVYSYYTFIPCVSVYIWYISHSLHETVIPDSTCEILMIPNNQRPQRPNPKCLNASFMSTILIIFYRWF